MLLHIIFMIVPAFTKTVVLNVVLLLHCLHYICVCVCCTCAQNKVSNISFSAGHGSDDLKKIRSVSVFQIPSTPA